MNVINKIKVKGNGNQVTTNGDILNILMPPVRTEIKREIAIDSKHVFANRLMKVFFEINKYQLFKEINIDVLAQLLGLRSSNDLWVYFNTDNEPDYVFIDTVAEVLGASKDWLKSGLGNMFNCESIKGKCFYDIEDILDNIEPVEILFVLSDERDSRIMIVFKLNDYKYNKFYQIIPFYEGAGAGGQSQIYSFYSFIKDVIMASNDLYLKSDGVVVSKSIFDAVYMGKIHPGCLRIEKEHMTYFWEDIIDLNYYYFSKEDYLKMYGVNFDFCQNAIRARKEV